MSNRSKQCLAEQTVLCPHTRPDKAVHHADAFAYDKRSQSARRLAGRLDKSAAFAPKGRGIDGAMPSQLIGALLGEDAYAYSYDNIGNREIAQEVAEGITYAANDLNQYTRISTNDEDFTPEYDADGNQTLVQTTTGIWHVTYNAQNRAIKFESKDGQTIITCGYDYMGRRFEKKVTVDGTTTLHERYIYRGYLQIAALDMLHNASLIHAITWDPTQEVATRPLVIQKDGTWYTYGWDLTKNICELYGQEGFIRTIYTYSPYGQVTAEGDVTQCIQWSSEMYDAELRLVYYNYRYYNPLDGRWTRREPLENAGGDADASSYLYLHNHPIYAVDILGMRENCESYTDEDYAQCMNIKVSTKVRMLLFLSKTVEWMPGKDEAIHKTETFYQFPSMSLNMEWKQSTECRCLKKCFDSEGKDVWFKLKHHGYDGRQWARTTPGGLSVFTLYGKPHMFELTWANGMRWNPVGTGAFIMGLGLHTQYLHLQIYVGSYEYVDDYYYL